MERGLDKQVVNVSGAKYIYGHGLLDSSKSQSIGTVRGGDCRGYGVPRIHMNRGVEIQQLFVDNMEQWR